MTLPGKEDSSFGENNKRPLMKSSVDYKDPQFYIYLTDMDNSNYILTPVGLPLVVHCTRFRMDSQGLLPMQIRESRGSKELFYCRARDVWFGNEYCNFFAPFEES